MNRKCIGAAALALTMILSGCAERKDSPGISMPGQSTQSGSASTTSSAGAAQSSIAGHGGAPTVIAPNFRGSSSAVQSVSETPNVTSTEDPVDTPAPETPDTSTDVPQQGEFTTLDVIAEGDTQTVSNGSSYYIEDGEMLEARGTLIVENGAMLVVEKGGALCVKGDVRLEGEIELSDGGTLIMTDDNAIIEGNGSVVVTEDFEQIDCEIGTIYAHITPPERVVENGVTTVGGIVIANKAIKLPPEYGSWLSADEVTGETYNALMEMNNASDHWYSIVSAYRSYYSQQSVFQEWCDLYGFEKASTISSQAGHSEHQTGLTMDLDSLSQSYADTKEGIWLAENCWRYGFIIRYPKGKADITGYSYEPWHVRYLGKSTAKLVFDSGLTLEEFLNVEGGTTVID